MDNRTLGEASQAKLKTNTEECNKKNLPRIKEKKGLEIIPQKRTLCTYDYQPKASNT